MKQVLTLLFAALVLLVYAVAFAASIAYNAGAAAQGFKP
jgi:Spy/CpxP family protein refolding chaperone